MPWQGRVCDTGGGPAAPARDGRAQEARPSQGSASGYGGRTMPTEAKREKVAELRDEISRTRTFIVSEYRGLKVSELAEIRRSLRKNDVTYHVVKNRLMRIAAEGPTGEALSPLLEGPTAIAFGTDEAGTAKAALDAMRPLLPLGKDQGGGLGRTRDRPGGRPAPP